MSVLMGCDDPERIRRQMPAYLEELSQFEPVDSFQYPYLDFYWREPDRMPYLIGLDGKDRGFALVRHIKSGTSEPDFYSIAEFYIQPEHRRKDLGYQAVAEILKRYQGPWLIQVLKDNLPARKFWQRTLSNITGQVLEPELEGRFYNFSFSN